MAGVKLGECVETETLRPAFSNDKIFSVNLYDVSMADTVAGCLNEMLVGQLMNEHKCKVVSKTVNEYAHEHR